MDKQTRKFDIIEDFDRATPIFSKWKPSPGFRKIFDKSIIKTLGLLKKKNKINILEVGCGHGTWFGVINKLEFSKKIMYTGIDFSEKRIEAAKKFFKKDKKAKFLAADYMEYNDNKKYNLIFFIEVFQYLHKKDFLKFFEKTREMLKQNGYVVIIDKEKYSMHSFKIFLGKFLKKLPYYYKHVHYPSFDYLAKLGKRFYFHFIKKMNVKEFNALVMKN